MFLSWCCSYKIPQTWWLTTTDVYFLESLKARSLESRWRRTTLPGKAPGATPLCLSQPQAAPGAPWLVAATVYSLPSLLRSLLFCLSLPLLIKTLVTGFRALEDDSIPLPNKYVLIYYRDKLVCLGINSRGDANILLISEVFPWQAG